MKRSCKNCKKKLNTKEGFNLDWRCKKVKGTESYCSYGCFEQLMDKINALIKDEHPTKTRVDLDVDDIADLVWECLSAKPGYRSSDCPDLDDVIGFDEKEFKMGVKQILEGKR
jgi:hypothetical protein